MEADGQLLADGWLRVMDGASHGQGSPLHCGPPLGQRGFSEMSVSTRRVCHMMTADFEAMDFLSVNDE